MMQQCPDNDTVTPPQEDQREEMKGNGTSRRQQWTRNSTGRFTSVHVLLCEPCKTGKLSVELWLRLCSAYEVAVKSEDLVLLGFLSHQVLVLPGSQHNPKSQRNR